MHFVSVSQGRRSPGSKSDRKPRNQLPFPLSLTSHDLDLVLTTDLDREVTTSLTGQIVCNLTLPESTTQRPDVTSQNPEATTQPPEVTSWRTVQLRRRVVVRVLDVDDNDPFLLEESAVIVVKDPEGLRKVENLKNNLTDFH